MTEVEVAVGVGCGRGGILVGVATIVGNGARVSVLVVDCGVLLAVELNVSASIVIKALSLGGGVTSSDWQAGKKINKIMPKTNRRRRIRKVA